jgi:superfamily II DNA/RNA helicase
LIDLFERGNILLNGCELLVIDEADRMLDMGFIPDIENICTKLPTTRQTLLFSATMPPPIKKLADKFLSNPKYIEVARPASSNLNIEAYLVDVAPAKKRDVLRDLIRSEKVASGIIFCNRKTTVRELNKALRQSGFKSGEIHGDIDQASRQRELESFKSGEINLLVASDVAARGLDVKGVSHVFNFDAPWHPDDYVHRIGRTGRAGAKGKAYTFVTKADEEAIDNIEKLIGGKITRLGGKPARADAATPVEELANTPKADTAVDKPARGRKPKPSVKSPPKAGPKPTEAATPNVREADRAPSPARQTEAHSQKPAKIADDADAEWNGPMPSFLNFGVPS